MTKNNDINQLYPCPYNKSVKCDMWDGCRGCEEFKAKAVEEFNSEKKIAMLPCLACGKPTKVYPTHCGDCFMSEVIACQPKQDNGSK